nr:ribonuclease II [Hymenolepis microstoma]
MQRSMGALLFEERTSGGVSSVFGDSCLSRCRVSFG